LGGYLAGYIASVGNEIPHHQPLDVRQKLMKIWVTYALLLLMPLPALAAASSNDLATAKAEILPLIEAMQAAANAHDAEKHLSYYVRDPDLLFVINDRAIVGYDALLKQQREWWQDGKTDVTYTVVGEPEFRMPAPGLMMTTYFLTSRRTMSDGATRNTRFGISTLWQRRPEGWRIIYAHESTVNQ
jgi:ketosteroid isomerase-like protein